MSEAQHRIAVDAMGADLGVHEVVAGALAAADEGIGIRLVGEEDSIREALGASGESAAASAVEIANASETIGNDEDPAHAARRKRDASVVVAARAVASGECDALVSAGATGATMAASVFNVRRLRGIHRPSLSVLLPIPGNPTLLLDAGANVEVRTEHLVQFAFMGSAFSEAVLGVERPRVGLLSVGEEDKKGTPEVVAANAVLRASPLNFVGNVEGRDLPSGRADVVVTDGFTGNIALKLMEGTAKMLMGAIRDAARSNPLATVGGLMLRSQLHGLRRELDPNTTGGAIFLGLNAVCVVAHGNSTRDGIANAIRLAERGARERVVDRMESSMSQAGALRAAPTPSDAEDPEGAAPSGGDRSPGRS